MCMCGFWRRRPSESGRPSRKPSPCGRAEVAVDERQGFVGQGERLPLAGRLDIGRDRQKHEGMGVEIAARVGDGAVAPDREDPAVLPVPSAEVAHHRGIGLLDQIGRARIPASPGRQRIGVDLARLGQQADRNGGQSLGRRASGAPRTVHARDRSRPLPRGEVLRRSPNREERRPPASVVLPFAEKPLADGLGRRDRVGDPLARYGHDVGGERVTVGRPFEQAGYREKRRISRSAGRRAGSP